MRNQRRTGGLAGRTAGRRRRAQLSGLTLLELCVAMSVLAVGLVGYAKTVGKTTVATRTSREATLANEAARTTIETMRALPLGDVYARYNTTAADDPLGVVCPGANFAVAGLEPRRNDADGMPGEILFPVTMVGGAPQLLENVNFPGFGPVGDLTGEGTIDAVDHAANYRMLPVIVRVRWRGPGGPGVVEFQTILGGY